MQLDTIEINTASQSISGFTQQYFFHGPRVANNCKVFVKSTRVDFFVLKHDLAFFCFILATAPFFSASIIVTGSLFALLLVLIILCK